MNLNLWNGEAGRLFAPVTWLADFVEDSTPHQPPQSSPVAKTCASRSMAGGLLFVKGGGIVELGRSVVRGQRLGRGLPKNSAQTLSSIVRLIADCAQEPGESFAQPTGKVGKATCCEEYDGHSENPEGLPWAIDLGEHREICR
jgi:hypothetical protein